MSAPKQSLAVLASAAIALGVSSGCAEWEAQVARDRGVPFGAGEFEGEVTAQSGLHVRAEPSTESASQAVLAAGMAVRITCKREGESIDGNPNWYKLGGRRWVSARYVANIGAAPHWCDEDPEQPSNPFDGASSVAGHEHASIS